MVNSVGQDLNITFVPKLQAAQGGQENSFMDALRDTYARETGKLVGTKAPGVEGDGVIFSTNPQNLLSLHSTVV